MNTLPPFLAAATPKNETLFDVGNLIKRIFNVTPLRLDDVSYRSDEMVERN